MRILIAPNAFKNALSAEEAGAAIAEGFENSELPVECRVMPIADGGDGTLEILADCLDANISYKIINGPLGGEMSGVFAINPESKVGIVELARTSGIQLLDPEDLDPWKANTQGTGEIIKFLIGRGCKKIYLTVGGSASVDGGMGILSALGMKFYNGSDLIERPSPQNLGSISTFDDGELMKTISDVEFILLSDVTNPLLGSNGAITVFGPQKGVEFHEIEEFEHLMSHWADLIKEIKGIDVSEMEGGGASGGVPAGLSPFLDIKIVEGAKEILRLTGFMEELDRSDLVITTEGKIDGQTAQGKGPGIVAKYTSEQKKKCIGLCGQIGEDYDPNNSFFTSVFSIGKTIESLEDAISKTKDNLIFTSTQIGNLFASKV